MNMEVASVGVPYCSVLISEILCGMPGSTQSVLGRSNDGELYVVKFKRLGMANVLANEYLGSLLLDSLGIAVPRIAIASLAPFLLHRSTVMPCVNAGYSAERRLCFASRLIGDRHNRPLDHIPDARRPFIENKFDLVDTAIFDLWANNHDRRQHVYEMGPEGSYRAYAIDNGSLFGGPRWNMCDTGKGYREWERATGCVFDSFLRARVRAFQRCIPTLLAKALDLVPPEWMETDPRMLSEILLWRSEQLQSICDRLQEQHARGRDQ